MDEGLVPRAPESRLSDDERDQVAARLRAAVGEGRLTPEEFEQRLSAVLAARTYGEADPYVADLPGGPIAMRAPEQAALRTTAQGLKRRGRWTVPRRLAVTAHGGSVKLDFADAVIPHRVMEVDLDVSFGWTTLVVPPGATVDVDEVEPVASPIRVRGTAGGAGQGLHFVVRGRQVAGRLLIRRQRRFWRWRW